MINSKGSLVILLFLSNLLNIASAAQDSSRNNLVHLPGYKTSESGAIPEYKKNGTGKETIILIPGIGFDASVFDDFVEANKKNYTMYAITIPGYGRTQSPPMPPMGTSYGEQTWTKSVVEGIVKLIDKEKLIEPIILGHFVQGAQLALRMAIDYPNLVSKVIVVGAAAKFIYINNGKPQEFPLKNTIDYIDKNFAPMWFKTISHDSFNEGNYSPEVYSLDSTRAEKLWKLPVTVPLPVMVRYLCEFFASDITLELDKIKCPVLIIRPQFNEQILQAVATNYVKPQFIDAWIPASLKNPNIVIYDVAGASTFVWKDKPIEVYNKIKTFLVKK